MARKSRKTVETRQPLAQAAGTERYRAAIYVRLSVENSGKDDNGSALETQKRVCLGYIDGCPDLELAGTYEDNGHTGTDFSRPGFLRLMEDIRGGRVNCIVVRDFSRFGRNYIETGTYLERVFPKLGVRFISVKEQFDSLAADGNSESLAVPLQNLINDYYSKDISRKVSAALKAQRESGAYTWHNLPYGYQWDERKSQIVPWEPYAGYVKQMFQWTLQGMPRNQIRKWLTEGCIPTGSQLDGRKKDARWTGTAIDGILKNPAYTGDKVLGRNRSAIYMGIRNMKVKEPEEWTVFKDDHEPLVSREDFERVQELLANAAAESNDRKAATAREREKITDLLAGKVFCPDCGGKMHLRKRRTSPNSRYYGAYECARYRASYYKECSQHYLRQSVLYEKIMDAIRLQAETALDYEKLLEKLSGTESAEGMRSSLNAKVQSLTLRLKGLASKRSRLYEDYAEGILDEEEYRFAKKAYDGEYEAVNIQLDEEAEKRSSWLEMASSKNKWISLMKSADISGELTKEAVDELIERVEIYEGGSIHLAMKYQDIYEMTRQYVEETQGKEGTAG